MDALGVDVGGVIIQPSDEDEDTSFFGDAFLQTPPIAGVFESLARLSAERFGDHVHVVSKCGPDTEHRTRAWLAAHDFATRTGIADERLHFCRQRREKGPIAASLGLTHFVDDKLEVLGYLSTVAHRYLFRARDGEVARHAHHLPAVHRVDTWPELATALLTGPTQPGA